MIHDARTHEHKQNIKICFVIFNSVNVRGENKDALRVKVRGRKTHLTDLKIERENNIKIDNRELSVWYDVDTKINCLHTWISPYPTAFPYGNGMVLHFYQQQESSTTKTVHKVINKGLKTYV